MKKKISNFYLFKQIRNHKYRLFQNQKPDVARIWPIRSEIFWSHVTEQLILGRGTVENFSKNLFSLELQLFVYKKFAKNYKQIAVTLD